MKIHLVALKALLLLFLLCGITSSLLAQENSHNVELERLERKLPELSGKEKLDTLVYLVNTTMPANPAKGIPFVKELEREAIKQNNVDRQAGAKAKMTEYYYYQFDTDSVFMAAEIAEEFNRKHKLYNSLFSVQQIVVQAYAVRKEYAQAVKKAREMYDDAKEITNYYGMANASAAIANIYNTMGISDEALSYYKEALNLLNQTNEAKEVMFLRLNLLYQINHIYIIKEEEPENILAYADTLSMRTDEYTAKTGNKAYKFRILTEYCRSQAYLSLKNQEAAWHHILKIDSLYDLYPIPIFVMNIDGIKANYYMATEEYEKALTYMQKTFDYAKEYGLEDGQEAKANREYAYTLLELGRYKEATTYYEEACKQMIDNYRNDFAAQINYLRTMYDLDKLELQAEKDKLQLNIAHNKLIAFVIASALLLAIVVMVVYNMRRIRKKNIGLVQRICEQDLLEEKIAKQQEEIDGLRMFQISQEPESLNSDASQEEALIVKLKSFLKENPMYTDSTINRKSLAEMLGTNENYIRVAIKEQLGYTFSEYMNELRLNHAKKMLSSSSEYTIEEIAMASGFNTRSTLHRNFRDKYKISPDEYRRLIRQI